VWQVRSEAVAAAQERLEATKAALERRREELRGLERDVREAARAADAAGKAAAGRDADLRRREVCRSAQMLESSPCSIHFSKNCTALHGSHALPGAPASKSAVASLMVPGKEACQSVRLHTPLTAPVKGRPWKIPTL
jgi:hypothetical protein